MSLSTNPLKRRIKKLNLSTFQGGETVIYVISRDLRTIDNPALKAAQLHAIATNLPLIVLFVGYTQRVANRAQEHITFLLEGLRDVEQELQALNVRVLLKAGKASEVWRAVAEELKPAACYFDMSPLSGPRSAQTRFANSVLFPVFVVDAHNSVPVWVTSTKAEVGARTLRPKLYHYLPEFLSEDYTLQTHPVSKPSIPSCTIDELKQMLMPLYPSNGTDISRFIPGQRAASIALKEFIELRLRGYAERRNNPLLAAQSDLSPYLHYGFISSSQVAREVFAAVKNDSSIEADANAFIEELLVRKELSDNYCYYNPDYLKIEGAPGWARNSLTKHRTDPREFIYTLKQFEDAATHDPAWNAAQLQLKREGKMHGYMRMYWAKKVLEWSESPEMALRTLLYLNDFYHLDGYDPNGYTGIMWSIAGVHDRPWGERAIYGTVRSMVFSGLKRKFDIQSYIDAFTRAE